MDAKKIDNVLEILRVLLRESYGVMDAQQECCGLSYSQCHTLIEIGIKGEVSLVDLASSLGLDTSTLSRTIQSLVVSRLVIRTTNEKDRRYVKISLTKQGRKIFRLIGRVYSDFMTRVFDLIPAKKHAAVLGGLGLFADAMQKVNQAGPTPKKARRK